MTKRYKLAVLIGRFEPFHNGHYANALQALGLADHVQILVGSAFQPRTIKNPFTFDERTEMISATLGKSIKVPGSLKSSYSINPIPDFTYNDNNWISHVQKTVTDEHPGIDDKDICILGFDKDESSWYNHAFPKWDFIALDGFVQHGGTPIDATKVRELYFEDHLDFLQGAVPAPVFEYLKGFKNTEQYAILVEEYKFIKDYKKSWEAAPFAPTFFTVDAVVIQGGHILLVKRKFAPGKGLWALPGGFLNQKETARTACIRELREETGVKVPVPVLNGSITYEQLFDKPDRSLRGRTLTQAFLIELIGGEAKLPKVRGSDDAAEARWFKISDVFGMSEQLFEDHFSIIQTMVGRAK